MTMALAPQRPPNGALARRASVIEAMAAKFNIEPERLLPILKSTVIKPTNGRQASNEEVAAFLIVAHQYNLNPLTREIHAFADSHKGIVPIVGIDGWSALVNKHPQFDGCDFEFVEVDSDLGCTCTIYVKGRSKPVRVTEWLSECRRNTPPWNQMKRRMLRHKAFMQCARLAFSISGIFDEDEARDVIGQAAGETQKTGTLSLNEQFGPVPVQQPHPTDETRVIDPTPEVNDVVDPEQVIEREPIDEPAADEPVQPPEPPEGAEDLSSFDHFRELCLQAASDQGLKPSEFEARFNIVCLAKGCKGARRKDAEARAVVLKAFRENKVGSDGKIVE